ncbi:hypothetical protein B0T19DRAFT_440136 [Cercophora scortea]|uniref:Uncharacterized protein n=1 Tax=Cercophora scortea TaxID=314031 RepID=A0AAE0IY35_9PEZI|nr:hypothetical protein B0T19DRAFT_440136 [Cercophora scortea]
MTDPHISIDILIFVLAQVAVLVIIAYWVYRIVPRLGARPAPAATQEPAVPLENCRQRTMEPSGEIAILVVFVFGLVFCFGYFCGKDSIVQFAQIMSAGVRSQAAPATTAPAPASSSSSSSAAASAV